EGRRDGTLRHHDRRRSDPSPLRGARAHRGTARVDRVSDAGRLEAPAEVLTRSISVAHSSRYGRSTRFNVTVVRPLCSASSSAPMPAIMIAGFMVHQGT